jgi:hypothetical protein
MDPALLARETSFKIIERKIPLLRGIYGQIQGFLER